MICINHHYQDDEHQTQPVDSQQELIVVVTEEVSVQQTLETFPIFIRTCFRLLAYTVVLLAFSAFYMPRYLVAIFIVALLFILLHFLKSCEQVVVPAQQKNKPSIR